MEPELWSAVLRGKGRLVPIMMQRCWRRPQALVEQDLRRAFPLLVFRREEAAAIRRRRCVACAHVTKRMASSPASSLSARHRIMQLSADLHNHGAQVCG